MGIARILVSSSLVVLVVACGDDDGAPSVPDAATPRDAARPGDMGSPTGDASPATCETDPLRTGLVAQQTGVSADAFDCEILQWAAASGEPDPMIVKAMIYVESRFDHTSAGCTNLPCGMPDGWTADESGCFGLMQVVPACGGETNRPCLPPNGHPNMTTDESSGDWASSVFNPSINIRIGIAGFAGNRAEVEGLFPGCTDDQYTLLALGNLANHGSSRSCTEYNREYVNLVLEAYDEYAAAAGYAAHDYPR